MARLTTGLPGALSQRKVMVETLTYVAPEEGRYCYLTGWDLTMADESRGKARGVQVIRTTEEGWAGQGNVTTEVRLLTGTPMQPTQVPVAILLDAPDDVQEFFEQYAPEVFERTNEWEQDQRDAAIVDLTHLERDQDR